MISSQRAVIQSDGHGPTETPGAKSGPTWQRSDNETVCLACLRRRGFDVGPGPGACERLELRRLPALVQHFCPPLQVPVAGRRTAAALLARLLQRPQVLL